MIKYDFVFLENMHENHLEFDHMYGNKTYFFVFLKWGNVFEFFRIFEISEKTKNF